MQVPVEEINFKKCGRSTSNYGERWSLTTNFFRDTHKKGIEKIMYFVSYPAGKIKYPVWNKRKKWLLGNYNFVSFVRENNFYWCFKLF